MKKIVRFFTSIVLMVGIIAGCMAQMPDLTYAASAFVQEHSDMIGQGGYIYYIRTSEKNLNASVWRMNLETGDTEKVISEPNGIVSLIACGKQLYYTTANDDALWEVRTCSLNGDDLKTVCEGSVCYADSENVYYIRYINDSQARLYVMNLASGASATIKTAKKGQTLSYVCNIGSDSYYYIYDSAADKVMLYCLHTATNQLTRVATEKRVADGRNGLLVSDVRQIGSELYFDFGSYEGSGGFWSGTIKKLTVDGKKKTVAKLTGDDTIIAGSRELYFYDDKGNNYKYNLKTGKKTKYSLKFENNIGYTILGDKTYMADTSNMKKIVISRFSSGTDRETLTKNFISIPFKQKKNISYSVSMKQVGVYYAICVTGKDFSDMSYGWRGKTVSINWYVTEPAGTVLGSFK